MYRYLWEESQTFWASGCSRTSLVSKICPVDFEGNEAGIDAFAILAMEEAEIYSFERSRYCHESDKKLADGKYRARERELMVTRQEERWIEEQQESPASTIRQRIAAQTTHPSPTAQMQFSAPPHSPPLPPYNTLQDARHCVKPGELMVYFDRAYQSQRYLPQSSSSTTEWTPAERQGWQSMPNLISSEGITRNTELSGSGRAMAGSSVSDRVPAGNSIYQARPMNQDAPHYLAHASSRSSQESELEALARTLSLEDEGDTTRRSTERGPGRAQTAPQTTEKSGAGIKKCWLYKNSRLPPGMLPFKCYVPTWTIICRAAGAALDAYDPPRRDRREVYIDADPRAKTKAMVIRAQPVDDRSLVIIAIRGSTFNRFDWAINASSNPTLPEGFLDDDGNACHGGFLEVARKMVGPIAAQLQQICGEDPTQCGRCSLAFTGHSAGGAVASLLFMHMLGKNNRSSLTDIAGSRFFRRIHCITFGSPPMSLLPLQKPAGRRYDSYTFFSFVNEGDPVVRMDNKDYLLSILKLMATPAPSLPSAGPRLREKLSRRCLRKEDIPSSPSRTAQPPMWPVPSAILSNAGRMVLLRENPGVEAVMMADEQLRNVVFADRDQHSMILYKKRVDELAFAVMTGAV